MNRISYVAQKMSEIIGCKVDVSKITETKSESAKRYQVNLNDVDAELVEVYGYQTLTAYDKGDEIDIWIK